MKRKVNRVGQNTLTVSLPSKWVQKNGILVGDEVEVEEDGGFLNISTNKKERNIQKVIIVKKPNRLMSRSIFNLYRKGVSEIKVKFDDAITIKDIQKNLHLLMGFEIVDQGKDFVTLRSIMKIDENEFKNTLRRLFLVTKSLAEESYNAIKEKKYSELDGISELESIQNRYYMFCCRAINLQGESMFETPTLVYLMVQRLEDIADDYKYICRYVLELEHKNLAISKETLAYYERVNQVLSHLHEFHYNFNIETGNKVIEHKKELIKQGLELLEKVPKKEIRIIHCLNNALVKIYDASSPIYGMNL